MKIKPIDCPLCGGECEYTAGTEYVPGKFDPVDPDTESVQCCECGLLLEWVITEDYEIGSVVKGWNHRVNDLYE